MANRSRLAELLGVEEDEEFTVNGFVPVYRIHNGKREYEYHGKWLHCNTEADLIELINNPSLIIHKPRFGVEEMTLLRLLHKYGKVTRISEYNSVFYDCTSNSKFMTTNIGESLNLNGTINLDEMFKEGADND